MMQQFTSWKHQKGIKYDVTGISPVLVDPAVTLVNHAAGEDRSDSLAGKVEITGNLPNSFPLYKMGNEYIFDGVHL